MNVAILAIVSYLVGFGFLLLIRSYDKYDKEPLGKMILFTFIGGIVSVILASIFYAFVHPKYDLTDAILKIGTVEEGAKLLTLFVLYKMIKKDYDEIVDGIVYVAAISLGFSVIENIFYALHATHPFTVLAQRFLTATIGHIAFSVYMGIAFFIHKKVKKNYLGLALAFILSVLAHGLYDGFIFTKSMVALFFPTYLLLIYFQFRLLKLSYAYSKFKKRLTVDNLQKIKNNQTLYCCNCEGKKGDLYRFQSIDLYLCDTCQNAIISKNSFRKLLKYFRPKLNRKKYLTKLDFNKGKIALNPQYSSIYNTDLQIINTPLIDFGQWLKDENMNDIKRHSRSLEGGIFKLLGFRFLDK